MSDFFYFIFLVTLGPQMLPPRTGSARTEFSLHNRILGLLLGLAHSVTTGLATFHTGCMVAGVSWAWEAHWRLPSSGMTSSGHLLIMQGQCCLQRILLIAPMLYLPRLAFFRSPSALLLHRDNTPLALEVAMSALVVAFFLCVSSAACARLPPFACVFTNLRLPAWSSVHSW